MSRQLKSIASNKRNNKGGNNKEDKSLWRTTTKLVHVIPVIKTKNQSKWSQDNVQSPRVATRQKRRTTTRRQATTTERREWRIESKTKIITQLEEYNKNRSIKTTKYRQHSVEYFLLIKNQKDMKKWYHNINFHQRNRICHSSQAQSWWHSNVSTIHKHNTILH